MEKKTSFRNALLSIMVTNKGRVAAAVASSGTVMLAMIGARLGHELSPTQAIATTAVLTSTVHALLEAWAISQTTEGTKQLQILLNDAVPQNVKIDGLPLEQTLAATSQVINK